MIKKLLLLSIKLWASTLRFEPKKIEIKTPAIIAFWHSTLFPVWVYFANTQYAALVSRSKDGRRLGELLEQWKYSLIFGSSSKGAIQALQEMIAAAENNCVLLTPDGPRGPKEKMKPGALLAAQFANVPVYLVKAKYKGFILSRTWDKTKIPFPFAKINISISEPIYVNTDLSDKQLDSAVKFCEGIFGSL